MNSRPAVALSPEDEPGYRRFLEECPAAQLFQTLEYRNLLVSHLGCESSILVARGAEGRIEGALPVLTGRFPKVGTVVNSLPFYGSNGGPLVAGGLGAERKAEVLGALSRGLDIHLDAVDAVAWTLVTSPFEQDLDAVRAAFPHDHTDMRIGQVVELPEATGEDPGPALMEGFAKVRSRNIRKAIRSGITVRPARGDEDVAFLAETHRANMTAIGAKPKERAFFDLVVRTMPDEMCRITVAELEGEPIASLLVFHALDTADYFTPAVLSSFRSLQPMSLLVFEAMKDAVRRGLTRFSFGGTGSSQRGVYEFKRKWGAADRPYEYLTRVRDRAVLRRSPEELLTSCPHFFVIPFSALTAGGDDG